MTSFLVIVIILSVSLNLWQLWKSIAHDERERYIQVLEKELREIKLSLQVTRARLK